MLQFFILEHFLSFFVPTEIRPDPYQEVVRVSLLLKDLFVFSCFWLTGGIKDKICFYLYSAEKLCLYYIAVNHSKVLIYNTLI